MTGVISGGPGRGRRPRIMGILNVTPDSFSDGGRYMGAADAVRHAFEMADQGADMIDIGGESTRPGASPVSSADEIGRIVPVIRELSGSLGIPISVDTMKADVAYAALDAGADMLNDVNGLRGEGMMELAASSGVPAVIMHMSGSPRTFKSEFMHGDVLWQIRSFLHSRAEMALDAGMRAENIILDPGIGFGTSPEQGMEILRNCGYLGMGYPVLAGPSRKRFLSCGFPGMDRDAATAEAARISADSGADIVRVHNVAMTAEALGIVPRTI